MLRILFMTIAEGSHHFLYCPFKLRILVTEAVLKILFDVNIRTHSGSFHVVALKRQLRSSQIHQVSR